MFFACNRRNYFDVVDRNAEEAAPPSHLLRSLLRWSIRSGEHDPAENACPLGRSVAGVRHDRRRKSSSASTSLSPSVKGILDARSAVQERRDGCWLIVRNSRTRHCSNLSGGWFLTGHGLDEFWRVVPDRSDRAVDFMMAEPSRDSDGAVRGGIQKTRTVSLCRIEPVIDEGSVEEHWHSIVDARQSPGRRARQNRGRENPLG